MKLLRALALVALCLMLQQGLARLWPESSRWVDLMLLPAVGYALVAMPRSAMLIGCLCGLLQDAWFGSQLFGANGFRKTLAAFLVSVLAARLDLNSPHGRFAAGFAAALADALLGLGLRELLDLERFGPDPIAWLVRATIAGLVLAVILGWSRTTLIKRRR